MVVLSTDELCMVLSYLLEGRGVGSEDARAIAEYLLNFFGYTDRVIDNALLPEDRDLFHMLEDIGVLSMQIYETEIAPGKQWHIHYWVLRKKKLKALAETLKVKKKNEKEDESIYSKLSDDVWRGIGSKGGKR